MVKIEYDLGLRRDKTVWETDVFPVPTGPVNKTGR